jgi:hypothetical protein
MSNLQQLETEILSLSRNDFESLRQWLFDLDYEHWDQKLELDIANGKLDFLAEEALSEFQSGDCRQV